MYYFSKKLSKYSNLIAGGFWNDKMGHLQFSLGNNKKEVVRARKKYFEKLKINIDNIVLQDQRHTANIKIVTKKNRGSGALSTKNYIKNNPAQLGENRAQRGNDGMITADKNVFLGIFSADCVPVLFYDPKIKICGAAHCGWRGTLKLLAQKMIKVFVWQFKSKPQNITCYLGPSIGKCCYEVSNKKDERIEKFIKQFGPEVVVREKNEIYLSLKAALLQQLLDCGIKKENVEISPICTYCSKYRLPSYYRDKKLKNSLLTIIGIKLNS